MAKEPKAAVNIGSSTSGGGVNVVNKNGQPGKPGAPTPTTSGGTGTEKPAKNPSSAVTKVDVTGGGVPTVVAPAPSAPPAAPSISDKGNAVDPGKVAFGEAVPTVTLPRPELAPTTPGAVNTGVPTTTARPETTHTVQDPVVQAPGKNTIAPGSVMVPFDEVTVLPETTQPSNVKTPGTTDPTAQAGALPDVVLPDAPAEDPKGNTSGEDPKDNTSGEGPKDNTSGEGPKDNTSEPAPTVPAPTEPAPTVPAPEQAPAVTLPQTGPLILPELAAPQITAKAPDVDIAAMRNQLQQWQDLLNQQTQAAIDRNVQQAVTDLQRAEQDAQGQFKEQAESVALDEAQGMDNSALYAEARGDKGGIGQAQYNAIQAAAAQNRLNVQQQQTKLSTDTARQIADLRAKGEFEKADAVLETAQTYLTKLTQLEQWAAEYGMSAAQFEAQMQKWQAEYDMALAELKVNVDKYNNEFNYQVGRDNVSDTQWGKEYDLAVDKYNTSIALDEQNRLADLGLAMLKAGVMPSPDQLRAMGISEQDAQASILAAQMSSAAPSSSNNPLGTSGASSVTELYGMLKKAGVKSGDEALSYLTYWGVADPKNYMTGYEAWLDGNGGGAPAGGIAGLSGVVNEIDALITNTGLRGKALAEHILGYGDRLTTEQIEALLDMYQL